MAQNNLMKYRSRIEITAKILESASNTPISKTRLMYMSYLSHEKMTEFADMLVQSDLLNCDNHTRLLSTTVKGIKFLQLYEKMKECLGLNKEEQFYTKSSYWKNELKSLDIEINKRKNELNDQKEPETLLTQ